MKVRDRPIQLVDDIPTEMKHLLINGCHFKDIILTDKKHFGENRMSEKSLYPNRLEQFLLKLVIPFLLIGHMPRGRYMQASSQKVVADSIRFPSKRVSLHGIAPRWYSPQQDSPQRDFPLQDSSGIPPK